MNNESFSKIWIVVALAAVIAGGILTWQYFEKPVAEEPAVEEQIEEPKAETEQPLIDEVAKTIKVKIPVILLGGAPPLDFDYPEDKIREDFETGRRVGCGDSIAFIEKEIEYTPKPLTTIYQILFGEVDIAEGTKYINPIISLVKGRRMNGVVFALRFERVTIKGNIANVYLSGDYLSLGTCEPPRVEAVLRFAAKQFPWIEDVDIFIEGGEAGAVLVHGGPGAGVIPWEWSYCIPEMPCNIGMGDCDTDADCSPGLFCVQNVGAKYGKRAIIDVCEARRR